LKIEKEVFKGKPQWKLAQIFWGGNLELGNWGKLKGIWGLKGTHQIVEKKTP